MSSKRVKITILEKLIAIFSLFTVGIFGIIWMIFSFFYKKKISNFLKYNIIQSIIIGIFLYIINISNKFLIKLTINDKTFNFINDFINTVFIIKKVRFYELNLSFTYFELFLFVILLYLFIGILFAKKFYLPIISRITRLFEKNN